MNPRWLELAILFAVFILVIALAPPNRTQPIGPPAAAAATSAQQNACAPVALAE